MTVVEDLSRLSDDELRERVESWVRDNLPADWVAAIDAGDEAKLRAARPQVQFDDWCHRMGEAGWTTPTWPREYGGAGLEPGQARVVNEVLTRYQVPRSFNVIG